MLIAELLLRLIVAAGILPAGHPFMTMIRAGMASQVDPADPTFRVSADSILGWEPTPNARGRFTINAAGRRGPELSAEASPRIAVIGDSEVFGTGLEEHETLPVQLEELLKPALPQVSVINFGVPGYNLRQYERLLQQRVFDVTPDLIVVVLNFNDIEFGLHSSVVRSFAGLEKLYVYKLFWISRFYLYRSFYQSVTQKDFYSVLYASKNFAAYEGYLSGIARLSDSQNIPLIFLLLPHPVEAPLNYSDTYPYHHIHNQIADAVAGTEPSALFLDSLSVVAFIFQESGRLALQVSAEDRHKSGLVMKHIAPVLGKEILERLSGTVADGSSDHQ